MRIIAGEFRGRKLLPPEGDVTRPVTDRVKQSIFDVLSPRIEEAHVYDCFAGTGSMGLECLSRGATEAVFFEMDRSAVGRLRKNIDVLDVAPRARIVVANLFHWASDAPGPAHRADLIFLDPPYRFLLERPHDLQQLAAALADRHLAPDGVMVFRHHANDTLLLPPLETADVRTYGSMAVEFLRLPTPPQPAGTMD